MSVLRNFPQFSEECVVCLPQEGDERLYMPLCGITHCQPNYKIERYVAKESVLEYIVSGIGFLQTSYAKYTPGAGDVYLLHYGSTHSYWTSPDDRWVKIWFNIRGTLIEELFRTYGLDQIEYIPHSGLGNIFQDCLDQMRGNLSNAHETATLIAHRLVYSISHKLYSNSEHKSHPVAMALRAWLEERIHMPVSLRDITRKFGYSASQLNRIFFQEYGETPCNYFIKRKLEYAAVMLQNTRVSIKEIAFELSFADQYYFSRFFKRKYGMSPKAYRMKKS